MEYIILGITNGVVFAPPSEWVVYKAVVDNGGKIGLYFHLFVISNTAGHVLLYLLAEKVMGVAIRIRLTSSPAVDRAIAYFYEPTGAYLLYGRCLPFFHSFTSVIAAKKKENIVKVFILGLGGNYIFGTIIYWHYRFFANYFSDLMYLAILIATGAVIHIILKRRASASAHVPIERM